MVQTFSTSQATNDIYLGTDGNLVIDTGLQAVEDACATASYAQLGEMILATTSGIPNFQTIWVGTPNYPLWNLYLRNTLLNVLGVTSVESIDVTKSGNTLNYTATINTEYGTTTLSGSVSP